MRDHANVYRVIELRVDNDPPYERSLEIEAEREGSSRSILLFAPLGLDVRIGDEITVSIAVNEKGS